MAPQERKAAQRRSTAVRFWSVRITSMPAIQPDTAIGRSDPKASVATAAVDGPVHLPSEPSSTNVDTRGLLDSRARLAPKRLNGLIRIASTLTYRKMPGLRAVVRGVD
jgi:hypothetical protein